MTAFLESQPRVEHALLWTVVLSALLHALAVLTLPGLHFDAEEKEPVLIIELSKPKLPPPPPPAPEKPSTPVENTPKPIPPKPIEPIKPIEPVKPSPPPPEPAIPPSPVAKATPAPTIMAAESKPEAAPTPPAPVPTPSPAPAPPPAPPAKTGPSDADIDAAKSRYGSLMAKELAKHKRYPKIAQMRGWEGEVLLELEIDSNGNVISTKISQSSTYDALDNQALEMAKKASFPPLPDALKGRAFTVLVPVTFRLE